MKYPITGTFIDEITYDIPSSNWSNEEWCQELDYMKAVGIDTLVFIRGGFEYKMTFPSKYFPSVRDDDFAGLIFEEAAKRNMQVFMGLYISNLTWNDGDAAGEVEKNKLFVREVLERYGDMPSFTGWYLPHESCRDNYNLSDTMGGLSALCKDSAPEKQVLLSPFFPGTLTDPNMPYDPQFFYEEWDRIFDKCGKDIDICAFQDGSAPLPVMEQFVSRAKLVCDKYNIRHWVNTETFERDVRCMYYPIPFEMLRKKLEITAPYAEKIITFEFSHFLSPQSIYPSARNLNRRYREYYENR